MSTMATVAEHMHRDEGGEEQHPNPVLRNPLHDWLLYQIKLSMAISLLDIVSIQRHVNTSLTPVCREDLAHADRSIFERQCAFP